MQFIHPFDITMREGGDKLLRFKKIFLSPLLLFCSVLFLRSTVAFDSPIVLGYIDRLDPPIILIEDLDTALIFAEHALPPGSDEGVWVNLQLTEDGYVILQINHEQTVAAQKRTKELHDQLRKRSIR